MPMPRSQSRTDRRNQILDALHACLLAKPFDRITIREIARQAGINHGLLHYYFESKEEILACYIDHTFERYHADLEKHLAAIGHEECMPAGTIADQFRWTLENIAFERDTARIFTGIWATAVYDEGVMAKLQGFYGKWRQMIVDLLAPLMENEARARQVSLSLMAVFEGMSLFSVISTAGKWWRISTSCSC
jgi:AcrR family transcriptional regulator